MGKRAIFIQGAGQGAYEEDKKLAESLRRSLGPQYEILYPAMPDEDNAPYEAWKQRIERELAALQEPALLIGHSVGGSVLIKWWSEVKATNKVAAIFLLATPFWGGDGWRYEGYEELMLSKNFTATLPENIPIYLYHARDDGSVPFEHLALYAQVFPQAIVRELNQGCHQLNDDLTEVAKDIKKLQG
jgi:predicted alpha/beta hydrolase family esterase